MNIKKLVFGIVLLCLVTACAPSGLTTAVAPAATLQNSSPTAKNETHSLSEDTTDSPTAVPEQNTGIWVKILEPVDDAVYDTPEIILRGEASPDTVININDEIVYIEEGKDAAFIVELILDEGENIIEILASNGNEEEVSLVLVVYYEPPE